MSPVHPGGISSRQMSPEECEDRSITNTIIDASLDKRASCSIYISSNQGTRRVQRFSITPSPSRTEIKKDVTNYQLFHTCNLQLIGASPVLRALSVINVQLYDRIECKVLVDFVAALDGFSEITCLYLGGHFANRNENNDLSPAEVVKSRLDLADARNIKRLDFNRSSLGLLSLIPVTNA